MKRREQALLFLRKAAQDAALLDAVMQSGTVGDEVYGFHCQQAGEKLFKALLSDLGVSFRKTHDLGSLMEMLEAAGQKIPSEFDGLDELTPFGALYRYEDFDLSAPVDRRTVRDQLTRLRQWVESKLEGRAIGPR